MSYQEKENIVNICSGIVIAAIYSLIIYQKHLAGQFDLTQDFKTWGIIFLIFMGVSIAARIIIYIIFHMINAIARGEEEEIPVSDERDKLIKLKGSRNAHTAFSIGMALTIGALAIGMPIWGIFPGFLIAGLASEIIDNASQLCYQRKGI